MTVSYSTQTLAKWTSFFVTVAVLAKAFIPFYLIGSTAIFTASVLVGLVLVLLSWHPFFLSARHVRDALFITGLLYTVIVVNFLAFSRPVVPATYLWGVLIIHGIFLIFGFSASRAVKMVLLVLLAAAVVYSATLSLHALRFGGIMAGIDIDDIFGIGIPAIYITLHQNIGLVLGIGGIAALGLASNSITRTLATMSLLIILVLLFHIAARTALVALAISLIFLGFTEFWIRSRKAALLTAAGAVLAAIVMGVLSQRPLTQIEVAATAPDAMSRTIRELQDPRPGFRMQIWKKALHHIVDEPGQILLGRGIGMYPVDSGFGAPDWLLHPTEGSNVYPHNVHLEIFYETGILGFLIFSALTFFPLIVSLRQWKLFLPAEKAALAIYVFILVSSDISGAFAYTYMLQFFFALSVGIVAIRRTAEADIQDNTGVPSTPSLQSTIR